MNMAQQEREERQAMRQRGAGSRNLSTSNFELDFPTAAGSREERLLMRQRGAGNREINNIDFGFAFATPRINPTRRSRTRSKTPGTLVRTPLKENGGNTQLPVMPAQGTQSSVTKQQSSARSTNGRKRRRLSEVSNITEATSLDVPLASEHSNPDGFNSHRPHQVLEVLDAIPEQGSRGSRLEIPSSPLFFPASVSKGNGADKENDVAELQSTKTTTKKRKRKSIGQQSRSKRKRSSGASNAPLPTPDEDEANQDQNRAAVDLPRSTAASGSAEPFEQVSVPEALVSPSMTQLPNSRRSSIAGTKARRKKRKSIVQGKTKRRSDTTASVIDSDVRKRTETPQTEERADLVNSGLVTSAPLIDEQARTNSASSPTPVRASRRVSKGARDFDIHDDGEADETYLPDEMTPEPTPAPKRAKDKYKAKRRPRSNTPTTTSTTRKRTTGKFPILTHRMTNAHTLPTITEEPEPPEARGGGSADVNGSSSADELTLPIPSTIITRSTPNAADVLAQACRETIDSSIQKLKEENTSSSGSRADRTRQITALQTFRSNLDVRLFDLSQSLDQRLHMEARLRKSRREKNDLQARWLEVRKQRDLLALRKDAIRREHWEGEVLSRKAWDISQAAHRLDTLVHRGDESSSENADVELESESQAELLAFSLREVGPDVSSVNEGGILNVLRRFNGQLEAAEGALG